MYVDVIDSAKVWATSAAEMKQEIAMLASAVPKNEQSAPKNPIVVPT